MQSFSTHIVTNPEFVNQVQTIFQRELKSNLVEEHFNTSGIFLSSLPFQYCPIMDHYNARSKIFRVDQIVHFLPFWDSFKGHKTGTFLVKNREDRPIRLNLKSKNSGHIAVIGHSGTGKSTCIIANELNELHHNKNFYVFKIDSNTTSIVGAHFLKSNLVQFSDDCFPLNPFSGKYDRERIQFLTNFLLLAIKVNNPSFNPETEHRYLLEQSIIEAYNQKIKKRDFEFNPETFKVIAVGKTEKNVTLSLDDVIAKMNELVSKSGKKEHQKIADVISSKLSIYYGRGLQAELFKGENDRFNNETRSFIYDFHAVDSKSPFLELISLAVTFDIENRIKELKKSNSEVEGFIIFEEIGVFGNNKIITDYFRILSETVRKKGFRIISSTPRMQSFFDTEIGKTALQISEQFLISSLGSSNVNDLINKLYSTTIQNKDTKKELEDSIFNEATISLLKSLKKIDGKYSEFLYLNQLGEDMGIFRYYPTSIELWLSASGNNRMISQYKKRLKKNKQDHKKTLTELCNEFPEGIS